MSLPTRQSRAAATTIDMSWERVRRWPGMRGEDKLAWSYLWGRSRGGLEQVEVSAAEVGADQGVSSDAGLARLKNLATSGLVRVVRSERKTGTYTLELLDPDQVSRVKQIRWDGQRQLPFMDESDELTTSGASEDACVPVSLAFSQEGNFDDQTEEPPEEPPEEAPEEAPELPRFPLTLKPSKPSKPSEKVFRNNTFTFGNLPPSKPSERCAAEDRGSAGLNRGTSGGSSAEDEKVSTDGDGDLQYWINRILRRVGCPNLRAAPCRRAAQAVLDGRLSENALEQLLENVETKRRNKQLNCPPSAYFNGGLNRLLGGRKT